MKAPKMLPMVAAYTEPNRRSLTQRLNDYIAESNLIEGIVCGRYAYVRQPYKVFLSKTVIRIDDIVDFVALVEPTAQLCVQAGMNVAVGDHLPPQGGIRIRTALERLLNKVNQKYDPYLTHCEFERLHPFTDGNGRAGRVLWLWQMVNFHGWVFQRSFLQQFYYQALSHSDFVEANRL